jgi:predicted LPLAT superfamily acyltransferase
MANWDGKTQGGLLGYKIFVFFIKAFGIRFAYFFLYFVAPYFVFFSRKAFKAQYFYFRNIHHQKAFKAFFNAYLNFCMLGKTLVDKIAILSGLKRLYTFNFDGEQYLRQMVSEGTGGILINAHVGNWDIAGQLLERLDTPIHVLMFDAEHQQISEYLKDVMTEKNIKVIIIREDGSHLTEIRDALSNKEIIAMNGDRHMEGNKVYTVNFMGLPAKFPAGPFSMAAKFKVPVTFAFAMKESAKHYHFFATPPIMTGTFKTIAERESRIRGLVEEYAGELERKLRLFPRQWFNYYQFWNVQNEQ